MKPNPEPEFLTVERQSINVPATVTRQPITIADMFQAVMDKGVTPENVSVIKEMMLIQERMEARNAEKEFAAAFNYLQAEMQTVHATKIVPSNDGSPRYAFVKYEDLMKQVAPLLQKHGFTVTFSTEESDGKQIKICELQHSGGHKRKNSFSCRIGKGPPGSTETQADGAAATYAKRYALIDALNIVCLGLDNDAKAEGSAITIKQAEELLHRVKMTNSVESAFLKFAGVKQFGNPPTLDDYKKIMSSKYDACDSMLDKKEQEGK